MVASERPRIAMVADRRRASFGAWRDVDLVSVWSHYVEAVETAGGVAMVIPATESIEREPGLALTAIDGLLLTGGRDIEAASYGAEPDPNNEPGDPMRDRVELAVARAALERDLPVLGVCRGMQLLNLVLGGGIDQHLEDADGLHRADPGSFVDHPVTAAPGSRLASVIGADPVDVRSHHHQGVEPVAPGLVGVGDIARRPRRGARGARSGILPRGALASGGEPRRWRPPPLRGAGLGRAKHGGRRMRRVRVEVDGEPASGRLEDGEVLLEDGSAIPADEARWLPPVQPGKIVATHLSYRSRVEEYRMERPPEAPSYFLKPPSSLSHHGADVARPRGCRFLNYEGEIALVIGKRALGVSVEDALDHVAALTVANDFGVHDFRHIDRGSMLRVKGQDGFCPLGPATVDIADVDPDDLTLRTFVNGEVVQEGHTGTDLLFPFAYQVADVSRVITLEPGDVLLTGTPANSRPVEPGDLVEVEVDGIGRLANRIVELDRDLEPVGSPPEVSAQTLHVALAIPEDEAEAMVERGEVPS